MGKKTRKTDNAPKFDPYDDIDDWEDEHGEFDDLAKDIHSTEWGSDIFMDERSSTRRKIERLADMKRLRAELADWEVTGTSLH